MMGQRDTNDVIAAILSSAPRVTLLIILAGIGSGMIWWGVSRKSESAPPPVEETCDSVDLAVCELHLMNQEDFTRMYQESSAAYLEAATQAQALAAQCQAMLVKVIGAPEGTEVLP